MCKIITPWCSNPGLLQGIVRRNPRKYTATALNNYSVTMVTDTQKTHTFMFPEDSCPDGVFERICWEKRWVYPRHGLFCRGFGSFVIDLLFITCNMELKTLVLGHSNVSYV
jgi:hypothetical protein